MFYETFWFFPLLHIYTALFCFIAPTDSVLLNLHFVSKHYTALWGFILERDWRWLILRICGALTAPFIQALP